METTQTTTSSYLALKTAQGTLTKTEMKRFATWMKKNDKGLLALSSQEAGEAMLREVAFIVAWRGRE